MNPETMPLIDVHGAQRLADLRESRGLSPEALSVEIYEAAMQADWGRRGGVDAHTIRRIERYGHVPGPRVAFVLASYFDLMPHELWEPGNRRLARERVAA
jgi:hypothetical protein